jgi:tetratricopeptide (TPR) repeat protein
MENSGMVRIVALMVAVLLYPAKGAFAENMTFLKEYTYQASDIDSKVSSRAVALEQVKRALLEQLGTYLISETDVKNYQLTKDQVTTLTGGIVSAEIVEEKWDGSSYYLKARIAADPKEVALSVKALGSDRERSRELEESRKKADEAMQEVERLKTELAFAKKDPGKQDAYARSISDLSATDWFDRGLRSAKSGSLKDAVEAYSRAIELNPRHVGAFNNRGNAFRDLGNGEQAIRDYDKAVALNPRYAIAYNNRGIARSKAGDLQQAVKDYDKAIELDPQYAKAHYNRGIAYGKLDNASQAIKDYDKAIDLDPQYAKAYDNRGNAYVKLGNVRQAVKDYDKAIELDPKDARAYYNRALANNKLKDKEANMRDMKIAARLGHEKAQEHLKKKGVDW